MCRTWCSLVSLFFFSSRRRHTRCALVTGVQTCALPIFAAIPIRALVERNPGVDWQAVDDVLFGCANQAGEDNRNVARMASLLAGLPKEVSGATVNRL